jgi:NADH-quinone oxidoreductase subunit N
MRVLSTAVPGFAEAGNRMLIVLAGATLLYGNLGAIPQGNVKRLLGYSSIAHAGYLLMGLAALSKAGQTAVLFYLGTYLFALIAAFGVIVVVFRHVDNEDIESLHGLHQRNPMLAAAMALSMVSLAGIPPMAGFFGKFLLFKAALEAGGADPWYYGLMAVAIVGVVVSFYYYLGVVRAIYWEPANPARPELQVGAPVRWALGICVAAMLLLGVAPGLLLDGCALAVDALK